MVIPKLFTNITEDIIMYTFSAFRPPHFPPRRPDFKLPFPQVPENIEKLHKVRFEHLEVSWQTETLIEG